MSRLLLFTLLCIFFFAFNGIEGKKCKKLKAGYSQIALFPPYEQAGGQFLFTGPYTNVCNCTKGQTVYNVLGSTFDAVNNTGIGSGQLLVSCNNTKNFCMKNGAGKKFKLKHAENLLNPPVLIYAYTNPKGLTKNLAVLNCATPSSGGNSSIKYNKKAGFGQKWKCKKQHGASGTLTAPKFSSKKGKKYIKVVSIGCTGCKPVKPNCKLDTTDK